MNGPIHEKVVQFIPGDLLWTKIGGYPFWPCMVTYDPVTSAFVRPAIRRGKTYPSYHVQYFGQNAQHGWTLPGDFCSIPFKGKKDFDDQVAMLQTEKDNLGDKTPTFIIKSLDKFHISSTHKEKWTIAVKEAEEALLYTTPKERFQNHVFDFKTTKKTSRINGMSYQTNVNSTSSAQHVASTSKKIKLSDDSDVCDLCQESNIAFSCYACTRSFHLGCVGLTKFPEKFKCIECISASVVGHFKPTGNSNKINATVAISSKQTGQSNGTTDEVCFECRESGDTVIKCSLSKCNMYYHLDCMYKYECTNKEKNVCPYHTCLTCYRDNPKNTMARKGSMVRCTKCPTAFHRRETCIPAGSVELSSQVEEGKTIICPYHYVGKNNASHQRTCNVMYCSKCFQGGELICCEACPNAFHQTCLDISIPSDEFICEDCENKIYLLYGMIVWVKIGKYRWWPGKILHPSNIPKNISAQKHFDGEFPVWYFGTHDYSWTHSGRAFKYTEEHKSCKSLTSVKLKEAYKKSLKEAAEAYDEYLSLRLQESLKEPEDYRRIKVNRALHPAQTVKKIASEPCICDPTKANPCGPESGCINRSIFTECHHEFCKAKDLCQNQMFQKRQYAETKLIKTEKRGFGLQALQVITKDQFVNEYVGEIITHDEYRRRSGELQEAGKSNYYFLYLDKNRMIDAGPMGNMSRFINHSCEPNCKMVKWNVNGDIRIGIFAIRDISIGEELTFDYQSGKSIFEQKCLCGAPKCRGFIGEKSTTTKKSSTPVNGSSVPKSILKARDSNILPILDKDSASESTPAINKLPPASDSNIDSDSKKTEPLPAICMLPPSASQLHHSKLVEVALTRIEVKVVGARIVNNKLKLDLDPVIRDQVEETCFVCKKDGVLICCSEIGCVKAYHTTCVGLKRRPRGWMCSIHRCSICQKPPHLLCASCPTSFCLNCWQITPLPKIFRCQVCEIKTRKTVPSD